jgi:serine/threonine protein kinase
MGQVYRAHDPRMGRDVALKVCAERFSERLDHEVRAVAALNHPNICTVYDVGPDYLLMELVEGESPRGPFPLETALNYARQIAAALEAAHEKGIVHRDLKPANIKITRDDTVKLLDFGLAKIGTAPAIRSEDSPTWSVDLTREGIILGTAAYMSPEQAKGQSVDKRADIWAFGVVLYELITGVRLFEGETLTETLAAVVKESPDLSRVPPQVRKLLESCLEKDPRKRLRDIGDVWHLLEAPRPTVGANRARKRWAWAAAGMLAIVAAAGWLGPGFRVSESPRLALTIVPTSGAQLSAVGNLQSAPEIAPDGSAVLYLASGRLYVRRMDSFSPQVVAGSEAVTNAAFWSADSSTVAFPTSSQVVRVRLPDGPPQPVAELRQPSRGGSWSDQNTILISAGRLLAAPASGGKFTPVEMPGVPDGPQLNPEFLPGGEDFLFLLVPRDNREDGYIYLATLRGQKAENIVLLMRNSTAARFMPAGGGRLLYVRNDNLYSQKLSRSRRRLEGEPELVTRGVASQPAMSVHRGDFSVARSGVVAWREGKTALSQVTVFDRHGNPVATAGPPSSVDSIVLSPDGNRVLASWDRGTWIMDVGQPGRLALPADTVWFGWSPDGSKLLGSRGRELVEMPAAGSGEVRQLGERRERGNIHDISPDGKQVLGFLSGRIFSMPLQVPTEGSRPLVETGELAFDPRFSPDGRWIVYTAREASAPFPGLYVQPFPGPGQRRQIAPGGSNPAWRKDGKEILYIAGDRLMSVSVSPAGRDLHFGAPQMLFSGLHQPAGTNASARPLDVSRDGSRIFWPQPVAQPGSDSIRIGIGWIR